ncbi:MAG: PDZ domain-containing protein [Myxococcales bacterium]|jgi:serine protease Do|nr:PDZ domain-containing protein [Myxococcales bacterium]
MLFVAACDRLALDSEERPEGNQNQPPEPGVLDQPAPPPPAPPVLPAPSLGDRPQSFADLAERADPAVVFVRTIQARARRIVGEGQGTGFVFDSDGFILTNNHVIDGARDIHVAFPNGRELRAEIVGKDPPTDVAVLRVKERGLPFVPLGDSDATRVGDWVIAIGNPFGLAHTVSAGIVSAKGRTRDDVQLPGDASGYYNFIQTDASINPGNSGGPLIDLTGHVVGMNTAIRQQANSIGFAIPINMIKELLPQLRTKGRVERSAIGVHVSSVRPEDVERLGLNRQGGALVRHVVPGGPAARAGLKPDDVIVAFDGNEVVSPERLRWQASLAGVGRTVTMRVARGQKERDLQVTLVELPEARPQVPAMPFGLP